MEIIEGFHDWYWLFIKEKTNKFLVFHDREVTGEVRWELRRDGYECIWDSARSHDAAVKEALEYHRAKKLVLGVRPISFKEACIFINNNHRHHKAPQGHKFSIALHDGDIVVGVIIAGRPVSRHQDDGLTLEVTRCCVRPAYKNGVSKLYAAACKIAKEMGYERVISYTLTEESGISMRASNFQLSKISKGGSWSTGKRKRVDKHPTGEKYLWERLLKRK